MVRSIKKYFTILQNYHVPGWCSGLGGRGSGGEGAGAGAGWAEARAEPSGSLVFENQPDRSPAEEIAVKGTHAHNSNGIKYAT